MSNSRVRDPQSALAAVSTLVLLVVVLLCLTSDSVVVVLCAALGGCVLMGLATWVALRAESRRLDRSLAQLEWERTVWDRDGFTETGLGQNRIDGRRE